MRLFQSVQVIIPAFNEAQGITPTILEIRKFLGAPYILIVNCKSIDSTVEIAKNLGTDVIFQKGRVRRCLELWNQKYL